jgi:hypothetical protein
VIHASSMSPHPHRIGRRAATALLLSLTLISAAPAAAVPPPGAANARVITTWNQIAVNTVTNNGAAASPTSFNYFAFVHLAMYNAVVGITGGYELYHWDMHAPTGASPEAAAAAAAHRVLSNYFGSNPTVAANLDAQLAASLALVPDGGAQDKGIGYGVRAADNIIALRMNDGRNAVVNVPIADGPGDWVPTSTAPAAQFASAWLGGVTPLAIQSATQFAPGAPPQIADEKYVTEFNEVKRVGDINAPLTDRSAAETQTARFFSDAGILPMQGALRELATRQAMDIVESARMFAAVDTSIADGAITVWHAKLQYMWWRPITAIRMGDNDGNDDTDGDLNWTPLINTPPYPDWPSGLCSVVGATTTALTRLNGMVDLNITSAVANETRYYATKADIAQSAIDARVWSGIHFRTADEVSMVIGTNVANYVVDNYFQPTD